MRQVILYIKSIPFIVEVAITEKERIEGLSRRNQLFDKNGMLFVFNRPVLIDVTMRETKIPLDILFLDENFKITQIETARGYQMDFVTSKFPSKYFLEIPAGSCKKYGIQVGNVIVHSLFNYNLNDQVI
jgi:uncharacterized membrane protein (UPF0127 family)